MTPKGGGLKNKLKTHCPNGHPYNRENTVMARGGKVRSCKICRKVSTKLAHEKFKAKQKLL